MKARLLTACLFALLITALLMTAQQTASLEPTFTSDGQLLRPDNYREWVFLTSGLGMTYGNPGSQSEREPRFDNVFVTPQAYKSFLETGTWPERTMFALEIRSAGSKASINKGGHFQEDRVALEVEVKDSKRFPENKWGFFAFNEDSATKAKAFPATSVCNKCHNANGAVDSTFVQFYPTLIPIAKAKGTYKTPPALEK